MPALVYSSFCKVPLSLFPLRGREAISPPAESRLDHVTGLAKGTLANVMQPGVCTFLLMRTHPPPG